MTPTESTIAAIQIGQEECDVAQREALIFIRVFEEPPDVLKRNLLMKEFEPPRNSWRPFGLSQAATAAV